MMKRSVKRFGKQTFNLDKLQVLITWERKIFRFLRIHELLSVKLKDIQIKETHSAITVTKLRTDQPRVDHLVYIARIVLQCCQAIRLEKTLERLI